MLSRRGEWIVVKMQQVTSKWCWYSKALLFACSKIAKQTTSCKRLFLKNSVFLILATNQGLRPKDWLKITGVKSATIHGWNQIYLQADG
jgi:hypothetical protein